MNTNTKISIFGEEVKKYESILTSKTAAIIFADQHLQAIDYEELNQLNAESLEKLVKGSLPESELRIESVNCWIMKSLEEGHIEMKSKMANSIFHRAEQMVNDDAVVKRRVMEFRWKYLGLI